MKKLLGIAALILAFSPFAQAQGLPGHPDARNDRNGGAMMQKDRDSAKPVRHAKRHPMKRHHVVKKHHRRAVRAK